MFDRWDAAVLGVCLVISVLFYPPALAFAGGWFLIAAVLGK